MAPQLGNYVLETATAPGTGSFTLNGPETNRRSFSAAFPNGGSVFYFADDGSSAEWGVGTLTIGTPSTLSRTTIIGTTSGGTSVLNFPGSVEVYNEIPAEYVPVLEQDGSLTLAGSLQVQGKTLVQNVDDWTAYQAIGAKDADARYVRKADGANDYPALSAGVQKSSGAPWFSYVDAAGTTQWTFFQPAGDYATNPALQAEKQRATTAENGLQSSKANLSGGNSFSGDQTVRGNVLVGMGAGWGGGTTSGQVRWSNGHLAFGSPDNTPNTYTGYFQITDELGSPGSDYSGVDMFGVNYAGSRYEWHFPWNGNIITPKGYVAFQSQLPFSDQNLRWFVVRELVSKSNGGRTYHTFPTAFSGGSVPYVIPVGSREGNNGSSSLPMIDIDSSGNMAISNTGMTLYWTTGTGNSNLNAWLTYMVGGYF
ncbi:hypothetical protein [Acetobacter cerevisiae]|uniref:hypothetical protein n=1 Tax=Acetobacter cerevisiae TaxID=178900 RepID=UPI0020A01B9B|nr:hypothetical protein [Acetobacter cerevisiae]MCP1271972.1 hypothetical protein [Acetobacter cerevisiae]MCP1279928.1 hypothetical protein [Acetobacter cerevisiae]